MMSFNLGAMSGALDEEKSAPPGVDFSGRSLKLDNANDAKGIVEAIEACAELRSLDLTGNTLGVAAAAAIARALERHPELERACWSDMFTGRMKTEIPPALSALGNGMIAAGARLAVLELSDNAFGPIGVEGLAALLTSDVCSQLQELRLNNNGLGVTGGRLLSRALLGAGVAGARPPRLRVFIAGRNRLENDGAAALAQVFQSMGSLEEIAMPQNGIYHAGIAALCDALQHNPRLRTLNLNDNTIGPKGAVAFANALPKLQALRSINFGDCLLKSKGALTLAKAFNETDVQLECLDLSHNEIGAGPCAELAGAVTRRAGSRERLGRVVLAGNRLGDAVRKRELRARLGAAAVLSDDEGSGDDDDDGDGSESDEDTESCPSEPGSEDSQTEDAQHRGHGDVTAPGDVTLDTSGVEEVVSDVARFLREPTREHLRRLGAAPADVIDTHLQSIADTQQAIEAYVEAVMLVSGLSAGSPEAAVAARELYACTVRRAGKKHAAQWMLTNAMLVHLGLIKSESKQFQIRWDLDGCYAVLAAVIGQPFFPSPLRETLKFFAKSKRAMGTASELLMKYPAICG